jgi:hypothetical protein
MLYHTFLFLFFQIGHCIIFEIGLCIFQRRKFSWKSAGGIVLMSLAIIYMVGDVARMFEMFYW